MTTADEAKVLSDDEVAEVAAMFPHAEYQPEVEAMPLCSFCDGAIDDHKANCVVPHVHALCATVRALRAENATEHEAHMVTIENLQETLAKHDALREQLAETRELLGKEIDAGIELQSQLAQVTQERDRLQEQLAEEVAKRVNSNVEQMEQSQKITQAELKRHCSDDRLTDTQRGSYQD